MCSENDGSVRVGVILEIVLKCFRVVGVGGSDGAAPSLLGSILGPNFYRRCVP